ncbi:MAG TPA: hypothetical protein VG944_12510 [Fimbriimonas sp.]|nr:hypothetical protein [Fimbriimonas sp.]
MNENFKNIDEKLNSGPQQMVAHLVSSLPSEEPSMLWRSGLNEALRAQSRKAERRRRFFWVLRPLSLTTACALAALLVVRPMMMPPSLSTPKAHAMVSNGIERDLMDLHQNDMRAFDVGGAGLDPTEAARTSSVTQVSWTDDSEADLEL